MKKNQNFELVILGTAAVGLAWIQIPIAALIVFTFAIFIVPLLLFLFLWFLRLAIDKETKDRQHGRKGLLILGILVITPFLSIETVDFFQKIKAEKLITAIEEYKQRNGCYPTDLSSIGSRNKYRGIIYSYGCQTDLYSVSYSNGTFSGSVYHSWNSSWKRDFLH